MSDELQHVQIYTDGSCSPNPGQGGWGVVIIDDEDQTRTLKGREQQSTNNRMELTAAIRALQDLAGPHKVDLFTDSQYVKKGVNDWLANWQRRGWTTISGEEVRNKDLWQALAEQVVRHDVSWNWVKGHGTDRWNNLADELAGSVRQQVILPLDDMNAVHIFLAITWRQKFAAGAWAGVMQYHNHYRVIGDVREEGTGNSLHIFSATTALKELKRNLPVHVYSTSGYLKDGAGKWLNQWEKRDWLTREGLEVSNKNEWQALSALLGQLSVTFHQINKEQPPCHVAAAKEIAKEIFLSEFGL